MATTDKTRSAAHQPKPASSKPKPAAGEPGPPATKGLVSIDAYLAAIPALTNLQRNAFRDQWSVPQCEQAGERTVASAVHQEALSWIPLIDRTLKRAPHAIRRYSKARFAWFLECARDLGEALEAQRTGRDSPSASRRRMERARKTAFVMRDELIEALRVLAGGDEIERRALEAASGTVDSPEALASSLRALCRLAEGWMERESPGAKALVASVDLTPADIDAARAATHALAFAFSDAAPHSRTDPRDVPAVNRVEGRVLLEMRLAMDIFERAHALYPQVPKLVPTAATRAVLVPESPTRPEPPRTGEQPVTTREGLPTHDPVA